MRVVKDDDDDDDDDGGGGGGAGGAGGQWHEQVQGPTLRSDALAVEKAAGLGRRRLMATPATMVLPTRMT
eukprot:755315-Hanusia_phi.AAC.3